MKTIKIVYYDGRIDYADDITNYWLDHDDGWVRIEGDREIKFVNLNHVVDITVTKKESCKC